MDYKRTETLLSEKLNARKGVANDTHRKSIILEKCICCLQLL